MIDLHLWLKFIHVIGACVLFGTGLGIAFFMWMAHRTADAGVVASTARIVVVADTVFTATTAVLQPLTGTALAYTMGYSLLEPWIVSSFGLYFLVGACWLPVVLIQIKLRDLARTAQADGTPLPEQYRQLFRVWFILDWPAFAGVIAILALMIARPHF
jgi:uncharacterized membrane protein